MASVVLVRVTDVVAACGVWCPSLTCSGVKVSFHLAPKGCKWMGVVVMRAPQVGMCRNGGADAGWAEEIECVFSLWEKLAPQMEWEVLVGAAEDCDEVGFESLNSLFGDVTSVIVWGYKLVSRVILFDRCFEILRTLIVKNVVLWAYPACVQSVKERLISSDHFA